MKVAEHGISWTVGKVGDLLRGVAFHHVQVNRLPLFRFELVQKVIEIVTGSGSRRLAGRKLGGRLFK